MAAHISDKGSYCEPKYVLAEQATAVLSEVRRISAHPNSLTWLNTFLDELLFSTLSSVAAAAGSTGVSGRPGTPSAPIQLPLTTDTYKTDGLLRAYNNPLMKSAILEAELVIRELAREGGKVWRTDPALRSSALPPLRGAPNMSVFKDVKTLFEELRADIEKLSPLGSSTQPRGGQALAVYCATVLAHVAETVLRRMARIVERDAGRGEAKTAELYAAMAEDDSLWKCFESMRTRTYIERDLATSQRSHSPVSKRTARPGTGKSTRSSSESRIDPMVSTSSFKRKGRKGSSSSSIPTIVPELGSATPVERPQQAASKSLWEVLDQQDEFESLLAGQGTMKVSLTPNRLQSMEMFEKNRIRTVSAAVSTGEEQFSRPKQLTPSPNRSPSPASPSSFPSPASQHATLPVSPSLPALPSMPIKAQQINAGPSQVYRHATIREDEAEYERAKETRPRVSSPKEIGALLPSLSDQAELDAKVAANRARRMARQAKSSDLNETVPSMARARSQPDLGTSPARKRFVAKDAAPRESTSSRELMDFLASAPPPPPLPNGLIDESASGMTRSRRLANFSTKRDSLPETSSPPSSPTSQNFLARLKTGFSEVSLGISSVSSRSSKHAHSNSVDSALVTSVINGRAADPPFSSLHGHKASDGSSVGVQARSTSFDYSSGTLLQSGGKALQGVVTPDPSVTDIVGLTNAPLPPLPPKDSRQDRPDTPPDTPQRIRRVPIPSHVPSTDAEETLLTPSDANSAVSVSLETADEAVSVSIETTEQTGDTTAEVVIEEYDGPISSEVLRVLLDLSRRMLAAPAKEHLGILETTIESLAVPKDDRSSSSSIGLTKLEALVAAALLDSDHESTPSDPMTPALTTDHSDEESHADDVLRSPMSTVGRETFFDETRKPIVDSEIEGETLIEA